MHLVDAEFRSDSLCRFFSVTGQHNTFLHTHFLHGGDRFFCSVLYRIGNHNASEEFSFSCHIDNGSDVLARLIENCFFLHQLLIADEHISSVDSDTDSVPRHFLGVCDTVHVKFISIGFPDGCRNRVIRVPLAERRNL